MLKKIVFYLGLCGVELINLCANEAPATLDNSRHNSLGNIKTRPQKTYNATFFTQPGVIAPRDGQWVGSDHLYNLPNNIGVAVEIVTSGNEKLSITDAEIKSLVVQLLQEAGIAPVSRTDAIAMLDKNEIAANLSPSGASSGTLPSSKLAPKSTAAPIPRREVKLLSTPPLPFLHVLIMVNPIEKGYVAYFGLRLFESVEIKRVVLEPDTAFQAITWEKQTLLIASTEDFKKEMSNLTKELTEDFISRYNYYRSLKP